MVSPRLAWSNRTALVDRRVERAHAAFGYLHDPAACPILRNRADSDTWWPPSCDISEQLEVVTWVFIREHVKTSRPDVAEEPRDVVGTDAACYKGDMLVDTPCEPKYRRMTRQEDLAAVVLFQHGLSHREIAERLGFSKTAISKCLKRWASTLVAAKLYAQAQALEVATRRVELARTYEETTDFLERLGVVSPSGEQRGTRGPSVRVEVGEIAGHEPDDEG